ncbi:MAG: GAF domain-containing protein [Chryseolinea sp.]
MIGLFSDRYKLILLLASIFFLGMGASLYFIYSLPHALRLTHGYDDAFSTVYLVVGATFLMGGIALLFAVQYKKEMLVFRDRTLEASIAEQEADHASKTKINLEAIQSALSETGSASEIAERGLRVISKELQVGQGAFYKAIEEDGKRKLSLDSGYAFSVGESTEITFEFGEGLIGQSAANGSTLYVDDIPEGYIKIVSGLGSAYPKYLLIVPVKKGDQIKGVIELASFSKVTEDQRRFVEEGAQLIADKISTKA